MSPRPNPNRFFPNYSGPWSSQATSVLLACGILTSAGHAASATWNGTTDALWATATNWSASPVPGSGDTAIFRIVLNGSQNFSEPFRTQNRTWSESFKTEDAGTNLDIASVFSGTIQYYNGGGGTLNLLSAPTNGYFTLSGSSLNWTYSAIPEPTSALAGLLIAAGILSRHRPGYQRVSRSTEIQ